MNASASSTPRCKRRKTSPSDDGIAVKNIGDLPNDQLIAVADYLPKTLRALFAVALTAPPSSWRETGWKGEPSAASKAIVASVKPSTRLPPIPKRLNVYSGLFGDFETPEEVEDKKKLEEYYGACWEVLDLNDVGYKLYEKLKDDDIGALLLCIDAKHTLKKLRLKCLGSSSSFIGHGLETLRGSIMLEDIILPDSRHISEEAIIPILDSIVDTNGNSLLKINLPQGWRGGQARTKTLLWDFYARFNQLMLTKEVNCKMCSQLCEWNNENSCQVCCQRICADCARNNGPFVESCDRCNQYLCQSCGDHIICDDCDCIYCSVCAARDGVDAAERCENAECPNVHVHSYGPNLCVGCRVPENHGGCWGCKVLVFSKLLDEKLRLAEENELLRQENADLKERLSS